jgi:phosphohistidine phosphatase
MGHRILLLRHAKSAWDDPSLDDYERPLAARGRRAAVTIASAVLVAANAAPRLRLVLCSPAQRAADTLARVQAAGGLPAGVTVAYEDDLYGASAGTLMARLRSVAENIGSVLVVGHNPGLQDFALGLAGEFADPTLHTRLDDKFPTAGLAALVLADGVRWAELAWGHATLTAFVTPRSAT